MTTSQARRNYSSGYTNVDILANQDLFPNEGYEFPPNKIPPKSKGTINSVEFPLNTTINQTIRTRSLKPQTPEKFVDPPLPKVRSKRSKLIFDATMQTRQKQVEYNLQKKECEEEIKDLEMKQEEEQYRLAIGMIEEDYSKRRNGMHKLQETYKQQFSEIELRKEREREEELAYERKLAQETEAKNRAEEERAAKKLQQERERIAELKRRNDELQELKSRRIEIELEEEARLQKEAAEIQQRRDQRAAEDERRRLEMTKIRSRVVEKQSKALLSQQAKHDAFQESAESAAAKAAERQAQLLAEKHEKMNKDRHDEWLRIQKEKQLMKKPATPKKQFPKSRSLNTREEDPETEKRNIALRLRREQEMQHKEKMEREKREVEEDLKKDREMLEATNKKFEGSLKKLQTLVPEELGIKVPEYTESKTRWIH